jgi:hypothetical protein
VRPTRVIAVVTGVVAMIVITAALLWPKPQRVQHMTVEIISPPPPPPPPAVNAAR